MRIRKILLPVILIAIVFIFFYKVFLYNLVPIPADTIVGLYHPFRDFYAEKFPNGIPFKNFLITDPVRQQYPWRSLAISLLKRGELPLWNPYSFTGTPLLANLQSGVFYPLNILYFFFSVKTGWVIQVILQPILAALFMFLYLRELRLYKLASILGAIAYSLSGFFIAWLEWNTVLHTVLWLPLILLSIEKLIYYFSIEKLEVRYWKLDIFLWSVLLIFSLSSAFLAGHLQIFFYSLIIILLYSAARLYRLVHKRKLILPVACYLLLVTLLTFPQLLTTLQFILNSDRAVNAINWQKEGWFIPWKHLVQFAAPDFFGNPATLNYWGVWNYAEFVGYIGVAPLIFAVLAILFRQDKKTLFFMSLAALGILFATPNPISKIPFKLGLPLISTSQPTRLIFIIDFSLSVLAALGFDFFISRLNRQVRACDFNRKIIFIPFVLIGVIYGFLWMFTQYGGIFTSVSSENLRVAQRNLILPTLIFIASVCLITFTYALESNKRGGLFLVNFPNYKLKRWVLNITYYILLITVIFDLFRFGWKFTPFTKQEYLFPKTKAIEFLQNEQKRQKKPFRIMSADKRILPPNFSVIYRLQDVSGYDPLYLREYGELSSAWNRNKPDISPIDFNRIITPQNYKSRIADLLNVKYILSLNEISSEKLAKVFEEGQTKIYENKQVYPRVFFVEKVIVAKDKQDMIEKMFDEGVDLRKEAVVYEALNIYDKSLEKDEEVKILNYSENEVLLETNTNTKRLLILSDSYYPIWRAYIYPEKNRKVDGKAIKIHKVDYNLRGIIVPQGKYRILFKAGLF